MCKKILVILYVSFFQVLSTSFTVSQSNDFIVTDIDLKILETADPWSASRVMYKIYNIYKKEGKDAIRIAVPAISDKVVLLSKKPKFETEGEGELFAEYINFLSECGDRRAIPGLMALLSSTSGGRSVPAGLLQFGDELIPALIDSLDSEDLRIRSKAGLYLGIMKEMDKDSKYFDKNNCDLIRKKLTKTLEIGNVTKTGHINALGEFGDESTIVFLKKMRDDDHVTGKTTDGRIFYPNRMAIDRSLDKLKKRLNKE